MVASRDRHENPDFDRWFATTHWTVVLEAQSSDEARAAEALGKLCETYWNAVHAYIRQRGYPPCEADDLTQQFFVRFLERKHYRLPNRQRGRFRSFLLTSVKHHLFNELARSTAQKRGGGSLHLSLDESPTDADCFRLELKDERTAEHAYEQRWALTLLSRVRNRIEADYTVGGRREHFLQSEKFLPGQEGDLTYAQVATRFGVAEGTVKSDVHRLKLRYRKALREEIAHTVASPGEIDEELRYLIAILAAP